MREIKFRFWDAEEGRMITPAFSLSENGWKVHFQGYFLYPKVMQYTGLKDKNGKEIYEGDIVVVEYERRGHHDTGALDFSEVREKLECKWNETHACFYFSGEPGNDMTPGSKELGMEVIGNIYENPEMVK